VSLLHDEHCQEWKLLFNIFALSASHSLCVSTSAQRFGDIVIVSNIPLSVLVSVPIFSLSNQLLDA